MILKNAGFETEEQLVQAIAASIRRARSRQYKVEFEVDAGVGIADLVLSKRTPSSSKALRALASISPRVAVLLDGSIGASIHSLDELAACVGVSRSSAHRLLGQLLASGLARPSKDGFALVAVSTPPYGRIIAVEAKLSSWQRALIQAYRNLQFADESWVVMDHKFARAAIAQIERFKASGVGLASLSRPQGLFIHCSAHSAGPVSTGKRWQAQAVLAARATGK
ncbi:helix-turn-helix domain-containing protein [Acidovorax sp. SUPP2539]|uniref:helix-turn-helix domain-containing protein n=1 Tax=Acidovorax sp. SUPP2539 TaxID=2920878 RepID=UPI0023DE582B|nr:helix-turn-helix domain-containing protein [Acidovorax sp. SUPP2539]GKS89669.1 hypothetical protein AVTE2539_09910 [Acidovorax sp. SUPP2539]